MSYDEDETIHGLDPSQFGFADDDEDEEEAWRREQQLTQTQKNSNKSVPKTDTPINSANSGESKQSKNYSGSSIKSHSPLSAASVNRLVTREAPKTAYDEAESDANVSYLLLAEQSKTNYKPTGYSDSTRWGKAAQKDPEKEPIYDTGSMLEKQEIALRQQKEREQKLKQEALEQLKSEVKEKLLDPAEHSFTYEELKDNFPKGVDPKIKEQYLSEEEFQKLFGMSKEQFAALGVFKKRQLKVKFGLF